MSKMDDIGVVHTESSEEVEEAKETLYNFFKDFEENNEPFNFNIEIVDEKGFRAVALVDFSIEDFEAEGYYVASVTARAENQPTDDEEEIAWSEAVDTAKEIIWNGAEALSYYGSIRQARNEIRFDPYGTDIEGYDAVASIVYNPDNLGGEV